MDPTLTEQAHNAARLAGNAYPHPPGTGSTQQPHPHTWPSSRPRDRDTDYGR